MRPLRVNEPIGTPVIVRKDDGTTWETKTRSMPWRLGHGDLVVQLVGLAGCFLAERCTVVDGAP